MTGIFSGFSALSAFALFAIAALAMTAVALVFIFMPQLITKMRRRKIGGKDGESDKSKTAADGRFSLAAAVFVVAVAPGLYWFSGAPETLGPKSDADRVVGMLLSAAERAQKNGDDKNAALLRWQAQLILQSSGEQQHAITKIIVRRILRAAKSGGDGQNRQQ